MSDRIAISHRIGILVVKSPIGWDHSEAAVFLAWTIKEIHCRRRLNDLLRRTPPWHAFRLTLESRIEILLPNIVLIDPRLVLRLIGRSQCWIRGTTFEACHGAFTQRPF